MTVTGADQTFAVPVTVTVPPPATAADCAPWSAASPSPTLMTVINPGPFTGTGQASVNVPANNSGNTRPAGTIRISSSGLTTPIDIQVTQQVCSFNVPSSIPNVPAAGMTIDVNVSTGNGCTWTASVVSPTTFIVLLSGSPGTGSGVARFTVQPNSGGARSGSVRIARPGSSSDVLVSQLAAQLVASFSVNPNPCPVVSGPSAFVVATCTFDASSSTGAITSYAWNSAGVSASGALVSNVQFPCGTFFSGLQVRDVTLTVSGPAGSNGRVIAVTFRKDSGC